ncbi:MAG: WYL domain-containing protein [Bacteroidales bacterium]|nr:WYL domain-containing protein [Bacteroidales bacterium]
MLQDNYARYIWLVDTIYRKGKVSFFTIDKLWINSLLSDGKNLPKRTFHRWREAITINFGIFISCDRQDNYKYYIENADDFLKNNLMFSLINSMVINNISSEIKNYPNRILLEEVPSSNVYLREILEAMRDSKTLIIRYQDSWHRRLAEECFEFEPYAIKIYKRRWYVIGKYHNQNDIKIYPLDRIKELHTADNEFVYDESFNGKEYFRDCFGIQTDERYPAQKVVIKFDSLQRGYIRSLPLHSTQKEIETTEEYSVFEYFMKPTYDFALEILAQGVSFSIIEPKWLKYDMAEYGKQIWKLNNGKGK